MSTERQKVSSAGSTRRTRLLDVNLDDDGGGATASTCVRMSQSSATVRTVEVCRGVISRCQRNRAAPLRP